MSNTVRQRVHGEHVTRARIPEGAMRKTGLVHVVCECGRAGRRVTPEEARRAPSLCEPCLAHAAAELGDCP